MIKVHLSRLILFLLISGQCLLLTIQGGCEEALSEPAVYRVRCAGIQELEKQIRDRFTKDPGFSMTIKSENTPDVFRICVLASSIIQQEIPGILLQYGQLLPKDPDASVVRIGIPSGSLSSGNLNSNSTVETGKPNGRTDLSGRGGQHYLHSASPLPMFSQNGAERLPNPAAESLPQNPLPNDSAKSIAKSEQSRDSFLPTYVSLDRLEQTLRNLLGPRFVELSPNRYLLSVDKENAKKQCTVDIDRTRSKLLVVGNPSLSGQLVRLIDAIDQPESSDGRERRFIAIPSVKPDTVRKILEVNRSPKRLVSGVVSPQTSSNVPSGIHSYDAGQDRFQDSHNPADRHQPRLLPPPSSPYRENNGWDKKEVRHLNIKRNPVIQLVGYQIDEGISLGSDNGNMDGLGRSGPAGPGAPNASGMEVASDFRYQILDDLDVVILDATGAEVARFTDMIRQIEELSKIADPKIEVYFLKHVNCISLNWVIFQVYIDLFRTKQGTVKIIPLINPNAMLLVGWGHAFDAMKDLIETLDKPVAAENNMLHVIRLKHASAQYVLTVLRGTFPVVPIQNSGFAQRVQLFADVRSNSIVVQAGPNDLEEIKRIVKDLDTGEAGAKLQVKTFKLKHTLANDLAQVLTDAITPGISGTSDKKIPALEMLIIDEKGRRLIESGIMADVKISKDVRTNTLIVTAPDYSMSFLEGLIHTLDSPAATAEIKVFQILYGDANSMIKTLQSLIPSQLEGQTGPQLPGAKDEDALVPVRFAVDTRTNSILAAGAPNDLKIVEALLYSIDREDQQTRKQSVYQLKSMKAESIAKAINAYIRDKRAIQQASPGVISPYQQIESEVIVIAESVTNSLIVSATPKFYDEIIKLISDIDKSPPQVVIQVLIGEVSLSDTDELGAEFGIQDSLLFNRSTFDSITQGTRKITLPNGTIVEEPVIVNGTANPGWLFNESPNTSLGDGYNTTSANQVGTVGSQLLTNFATGRVGAETGFGGMVFSANSDAVSIMIRALQETNRLEILSRPQITAMNNQPAYIHVGQLVPRVQGTTSSSYSQDTKVEDEPVGLLLMVTPNISPEGNVVMLVAAEKSKMGRAADGVPVGYSDGKAVYSPVIDKIRTMTMIGAADNETVVLGGLISKENQEIHRKVPLLGDIPLLGKLFQYEFNRCKRSELLIILTPRIIKNGCDMDQIKQIETARMSWCLGSVAKLHGDIGTYNVISEKPYAGDAKIVYPDTVDMDDLTPIRDASPPNPEAAKPAQPGPTLAPPAPDPPKLPTPVLPKK